MLSQFFHINSAIGINLTIESNGESIVSACQVAKQKKQLDFEQRAAELTSFKDLAEKFNVKLPVAINLSGKGVLSKAIEKIETLTDGNFSQVLPNAKIEDFYVQNFVSGEKSYVSVIRKTDADKWLLQLREIGCRVVSMSLGPFAVNAILPQLNFYDSEVVFDGHVIQRDENKNWTSCRYDGLSKGAFPIKIESERIEERLVLAYAAAFQLVMDGKVDAVQVPDESISAAYRQVSSAKWARAYAAFAIVGLFVLLLINTLMFFWLSDDNARLGYRLSSSVQSTSDLRRLEEQVIKKELKLKNLGWNKGINSARVLDKLAASTPEDVTWKEVAISPVVLKRGAQQNAISFDDNKIRVSGLSSEIISVNEWMARIKAEKWARSVALESYDLNRELKTGEFTLIIRY